MRLFAGAQSEGMLCMKRPWIGLGAVLLAVVAIIGYKTYLRSPSPDATSSVPRVLLVTDLSEADSAGDGCSQIIHLVRATGERGIAVQELEPGSSSPLLARYHVLTFPTVLILDRSGQVVTRFEGESRETVEAVRAGLAQLQ